MNETTFQVGNLLTDFPRLREHLQAEILAKFPNTTEEDKTNYAYLNEIEQMLNNLNRREL